MNKKNILVVGIIIVIFLFLVSFVYSNGNKVINEPYVTWISHTEYWSSSGPGSNEVASSIIRVTNYKGESFDGVTGCKVTILYPNKTPYISNKEMVESGIAGNWYRTDPVPTTEGTYEQLVTCTYGAGKTIKTSQSFHVNPALNFLKNISLDILATSVKLSNVNLSITATVNNAKDEIKTEIFNAETNIKNLMNTLNTNLSNQLASTKSDLSTQMKNINLSLSADVGNAKDAIQTQLSNLNYSISNLIIKLNNELKSDLVSYLKDINKTTIEIYADTQWLVTNAMNQADKAQLIARFNSIDGNLSVIEQFCSNTQTSTSSLCTDITNIKSKLDVLKNEQTDYFNKLNQTTTNTFNLLSGEITTKINSILSELGIIRSQTTDINATVHEIKDEMEARVYGHMIS